MLLLLPHQNVAPVCLKSKARHSLAYTRHCRSAAHLDPFASLRTKLSRVAA